MERTFEEMQAMLEKVYPDYRVIDFSGSRGRIRLWRENLHFAWWDLRARLRHRFGSHTMIPLEVWDRERGTIEFDGETCWLCPFRAG